MLKIGKLFKHSLFNYLEIDLLNIQRYSKYLHIDNLIFLIIYGKYIRESDISYFDYITF